MLFLSFVQASETAPACAKTLDPSLAVSETPPVVVGTLWVVTTLWAMKARTGASTLFVAPAPERATLVCWPEAYAPPIEKASITGVNWADRLIEPAVVTVAPLMYARTPSSTVLCANPTAIATDVFTGASGAAPPAAPPCGGSGAVSLAPAAAKAPRNPPLLASTWILPPLFNDPLVEALVLS